MSAKITQALHAVMSEVSYVQKTEKNAFHNYRYAGEAGLLEKLRPAMLKHGLLLIPSITEVTPIDEHGNTTVRIAYTLAHKDGDIWPHPIGAAGTGNDKNSKGGVGDKGTYKAITGANKYLLFKLFQIETGDDPESAETEVAPPRRVMAEAPVSNSSLDVKAVVADLVKMIERAPTLGAMEALKRQGTDFENRYGVVPENERGPIKSAWSKRKLELGKAEIRMAG